METPAPAPSITILPATKEDYPTLARLEHKVFNDDDWTIVAFGPDRNSEAAVAWMAAAFSREPSDPGTRSRIMKAVCGDEIVGFAGWSLNPNQMRDENIEEKAEENQDEEVTEKWEPWPPGANVRFCEDAYIGGDAHMYRSVEGESFAKLSVISILPQYQRRGIGSRFMEIFIREVDEAGVPAVLGASPEGLGLYKKFGFEEVIVMQLDLRKYGGTEEMGVVNHNIMRRPSPPK